MRAAVAALRSQHPLHVIVAVPVASDDALAAVQAVADAVICPLTPTAFLAVGAWYDDFEQTSDAEVRRLLEDAQAHLPEDARAGAVHQCAIHAENVVMLDRGHLRQAAPAIGPWAALVGQQNGIRIGCDDGLCADGGCELWNIGKDVYRAAQFQRIAHHVFSIQRHQW